MKHKNEVSNYLYKTLLFRLRIKAEDNDEVLKEIVDSIIESIDDSKNELLLMQKTEPF